MRSLAYSLSYRVECTRVLSVLWQIFLFIYLNIYMVLISYRYRDILQIFNRIWKSNNDPSLIEMVFSAMYNMRASTHLLLTSQRHRLLSNAFRDWTMIGVELNLSELNLYVKYLPTMSSQICGAVLCPFQWPWVQRWK